MDGPLGEQRFWDSQSGNGGVEGTTDASEVANVIMTGTGKRVDLFGK